MRIAPMNMEIEKIYTQTFGAGKTAIAVSSANSDEGVTSIALALAQRNLLAGHSTLLVDLNQHHPSLKKICDVKTTESTNLLSSPQLVGINNESIALTGITSPTQRDLILKLRKPGVLEQCIEKWLKSFDSIIFDTSPINRINANNIPAERVSAACDGCLLVVLAGSTTEAMITTANEKLKSADASLLACIFNDRENPNLKNDLLRKVNQFRPIFKWVTFYIKRWIENNRFLSLEV